MRIVLIDRNPDRVALRGGEVITRVLTFNSVRLLYDALWVYDGGHPRRVLQYSPAYDGWYVCDDTPPVVVYSDVEVQA